MDRDLVLPDGLEHVRTTDVFDERRHPAGLLRAHRVADGVWARLVVHSGSLVFTFDDDPDRPRAVGAGGTVVIPPARLHHLTFDGPVTFALEFHRQPATDTPVAGDESTGLTP
jgi:tellurite resistance-related uncharacterized protein